MKNKLHRTHTTSHIQYTRSHRPKRYFFPLYLKLEGDLETTHHTYDRNLKPEKLLKRTAIENTSHLRLHNHCVTIKKMTLQSEA